MDMTRAFAIAVAAVALGGCIVEDYPRNHPRYRHRYVEPAPVVVHPATTVVQPAATVVQPAPVVVAPSHVVQPAPVIVVPPGGPHSGTIRPPRHPPKRHHAAKPAPKPVVVKPAPKPQPRKSDVRSTRGNGQDARSTHVVAVKPAPKHQPKKTDAHSTRQAVKPPPKSVGTPPPKSVGKPAPKRY